MREEAKRIVLEILRQGIEDCLGEGVGWIGAAGLGEGPAGEEAACLIERARRLAGAGESRGVAPAGGGVGLRPVFDRIELTEKHIASPRRFRRQALTGTWRDPAILPIPGDHVPDEEIRLHRGELNARLMNLLMSSGGRFHILVPNLPGAEETLRRF